MPLTKYSPTQRGGGGHIEVKRECVWGREKGKEEGERHGVCLLQLRSLEDRERDKKEGIWVLWFREAKRDSTKVIIDEKVLEAKRLLASEQPGETAESQERNSGRRGGSWWLRDPGKSVRPDSTQAEFYSYLVPFLQTLIIFSFVTHTSRCKCPSALSICLPNTLVQRMKSWLSDCYHI